MTISQVSAIPGVVFFLIFLRSNRSNTRIVFFILLASAVADVSNYYFIRYVYPNSYIISNTWYLVNYVLMTWLFVKLIPGRSRLLRLSVILFFVGSSITFLTLYSYLESNTFIRVYSSIAFTLFTILSFFEVLKESPTDQLSKFPVFWIITSLFLYSSITLLKNLFAQYLVFDAEVSWDLYAFVSFFNLLFNVVKNFLLFYALILVHNGHPDSLYSPKPASQ